MIDPQIIEKFREVEQMVHDRYVGKFATIVTNWRDQPIGRSKKNLKGSVVEILRVSYHVGSFWISAKLVSTGRQLDCSLRPTDLELCK